MVMRIVITASTAYKQFHAWSVFMNVYLYIFFLVYLRFFCRFDYIHTLTRERVYRSLLAGVHFALRTLWNTCNVVLLHPLWISLLHMMALLASFVSVVYAPVFSCVYYGSHLPSINVLLSTCENSFDLESSGASGIRDRSMFLISNRFFIV